MEIRGSGFGWNQKGDVLNLFVMANSILYLIYFIMAHLGLLYMDPNTKRDGFCITNPTDPLWNSHMLSFYVDVLLSGVSVVVVALTSSGSNARDFLSRSIPGTIGHGFGHLGLSRRMNEAPSSTSLMTLPLYLQLLAPIGIFFFWYSLLGSNKYIPRLHLVIHSVLHSIVLLTPILPLSAGFAYVQTVLVLTFTIYDIFLRPKSTKDVAYDYSPFVSVPFSVVAWMEALTCEGFLKSKGGHMWYDASIPLAILVYYFAVRGLEGKITTN